MLNERESDIIVGVFRERVRAQDGVEALVRAGFSSDAVGLVTADASDMQQVAELMGADAEEWLEPLESPMGSLVPVSCRGRGDDSRPILA